MATTTNYGWTTPDDTALVKDGAAAIRTLGSSIDSTLKTQIDAQIPDSLLTTKGDLIAATGASTPARLAVGTNDQVLMADSTTATGMKWAGVPSGGMTLLSTTTLTGATTTISSISQSYTNLFMIISGVTNATNDGRFRCAPNAQTTISYAISTSGTGAGLEARSDEYMYFAIENVGRTSSVNSWGVWIYNYASTTAVKNYATVGILTNPVPAIKPFFSFGGINTTSGISSLQFSNVGGNLSTGTVLLYGVK